jgi:hypothetical protein
MKAERFPAPELTQDFQSFIQFFSATPGIGIFAHRQEILCLEP